MKDDKLRKSSLLFLAILLATTWTLTSSTMGWADGRGEGHGKRPDAAYFIWHVIKAKEALSLSDEQETRLRTIATNFKKDRVRKHAEVELAEIDMHQLLHRQDKQANAEDIDTAVRKMYGLKADLRIASIKAFQEARTVLTPEQWQKMKEVRGREKGAMESKRSEQHGGSRHADEG